MEGVVLVVQGAVKLNKKRERVAALAATHALRCWKVARVQPHLIMQYRLKRLQRHVCWILCRILKQDSDTACFRGFNIGTCSENRIRKTRGLGIICVHMYMIFGGRCLPVSTSFSAKRQVEAAEEY